METKKIGILGASSYTGCELVRLLSRHRGAEIAFVSSRSYVRQPLHSVYPVLRGVFDGVCIHPDEACENDVDCVFSCLPHGVSASLLLPFIERGVKVIDLSADFRLRSAHNYASWYNTTHPAPQLLDKAVYGLPELFREEIASASILANPGCYPTSILLALLPLVGHGMIPHDAVVVADSKSGLTGAGRTLKQHSHFVEVNENMTPYAAGQRHRHVAEMQQLVQQSAGATHNAPPRLVFTPHLLPVNRGILSTMYTRVHDDARACHRILSDAYANEPFVRVQQPDVHPDLHRVARTNYCDIGVTESGEDNFVIITSAIDNLTKGASGQALQCMNCMLQFPEAEGLDL